MKRFHLQIDPYVFTFPLVSGNRLDTASFEQIERFRKLLHDGKLPEGRITQIDMPRILTDEELEALAKSEREEREEREKAEEESQIDLKAPANEAEEEDKSEGDAPASIEEATEEMPDSRLDSTGPSAEEIAAILSASVDYRYWRLHADDGSQFVFDTRACAE
jgi:hypothetical protein